SFKTPKESVGGAPTLCALLCQPPKPGDDLRDGARGVTAFSRHAPSLIAWHPCRRATLIGPVRIPVFSRRGELFRFLAVSERHPDLLRAAACGLENQPAPIGRPGRMLVATRVVGQLHRAPRRNLDDVDIVGPGVAEPPVEGHEDLGG